MNYRWNTKQIVADFGGPNDLAARFGIPDQNVRAWVRRDRIPPEWLATLITVKTEIYLPEAFEQLVRSWIVEDIF